MSVDISKTAFTTEYPIDKIFAEGTEQYTMPTADGVIQSNLLQLTTIPNPYGKKGLPTASWSIDGVNFYDQGSSLYFQPSPTNYVPAFRVLVGCSDESIYFFTYNGYTVSLGYPSSYGVTVKWTVANIL